MSNQKYKNVGKKQIINVISQLIHKIEAIELTLNAFIEFSGEEVSKQFDDYMINKLGDKDELQSDDKVDGEGNNPDSNENT